MLVCLFILNDPRVKVEEENTKNDPIGQYKPLQYAVKCSGVNFI